MDTAVYASDIFGSSKDDMRDCLVPGHFGRELTGCPPEYNRSAHYQSGYHIADDVSMTEDLDGKTPSSLGNDCDASVTSSLASPPSSPPSSALQSPKVANSGVVSHGPKFELGTAASKQTTRCGRNVRAPAARSSARAKQLAGRNVDYVVESSGEDSEESGHSGDADASVTSSLRRKRTAREMESSGSSATSSVLAAAAAAVASGSAPIRPAGSTTLSVNNPRLPGKVAQSEAVRAAIARAAELTPVHTVNDDDNEDIRKERNKNSASQYRKRRKVFVELLEEKVADLEVDNLSLRDRVLELERQLEMTRSSASSVCSEPSSGTVSPLSIGARDSYQDSRTYSRGQHAHVNSAYAPGPVVPSLNAPSHGGMPFSVPSPVEMITPSGSATVALAHDRSSSNYSVSMHTAPSSAASSPSMSPASPMHSAGYAGAHAAAAAPYGSHQPRDPMAGSYSRPDAHTPHGYAHSHSPSHYESNGFQPNPYHDIGMPSSYHSGGYQQMQHARHPRDDYRYGSGIMFAMFACVMLVSLPALTETTLSTSSSIASSNVGTVSPATRKLLWDAAPEWGAATETALPAAFAWVLSQAREYPAFAFIAHVVGEQLGAPLTSIAVGVTHIVVGLVSIAGLLLTSLIGKAFALVLVAVLIRELNLSISDRLAKKQAAKTDKAAQPTTAAAAAAPKAAKADAAPAVNTPAASSAGKAPAPVDADSVLTQRVKVTS